MINSQKQAPAILLLEDGTVHRGRAFGKKGTTCGEICFNTGMTGYQEVFTDPSYYGQVVIMNNVHIGNYGVKDEDIESDSVKIKGLIGRNLEDLYSRKMAKGSLEEYLVQNNIVCIEDVDTRALVTHVRQKGAMNCIISSEILDVEELKKELKIKALKAAKEKAAYMVEALGGQLGDVLEIQDGGDSPVQPVMYRNYAMKAEAADMAGGDADLDFKKIKLNFTVNTVFEIK